jgi:translation initiation factor IF-1
MTAACRLSARLESKFSAVRQMLDQIHKKGQTVRLATISSAPNRGRRSVDLPNGAGGRQPKGTEGERAATESDVGAVQGTVSEALPNDMFAIDLDEGQRIIGHMPGGTRNRFVRVLPGDRVTVELSPYDLSRGRITERHR